MAYPKSSEPVEDTNLRVNLAILSTLERLNPFPSKGFPIDE